MSSVYFAIRRIRTKELLKIALSNDSEISLEENTKNPVIFVTTDFKLATKLLNLSECTRTQEYIDSEINACREIRCNGFDLPLNFMTNPNYSELDERRYLPDHFEIITI